MEEFKSIQDLLCADTVWKAFCHVDTTNFESRPFSLEERYGEVASIVLNTNASEEVQSQFNIAKMLYVYAWYYYPFLQVAELKAYSTLELALQNRFPGKQGLKKLLTLAIDQGLVQDSDFYHIKVDPNKPLEYTRKLPETIPVLRNSLAHGEFMLHSGVLFVLRNCSEIINKIV